jgi:hypothetical protein
MDIPVLPKNYRRIALAAIALASDPVVLMNRQRITDYSSDGALTQKGIRACRDFEVRDGARPIVGFHDHPDEMWIAAAYRHFAEHCAREGWLKMEGSGL